MLIQEKTIKMKDGRTAILRSPREEDALMLLELIKAVVSDTDFLMRSPEECTLTEQQELEWIRRHRESDSTCSIICQVEGEIAGNCEIRFGQRLKTRHRGTIGISLRRPYWNQGIGTAMFEEMIRIAREREGVSILDLEFMEGNHRAQALYEKMGFAVVGCKPNAFRLKDGTLRKEFYMQKML